MTKTLLPILLVLAACGGGDDDTGLSAVGVPPEVAGRYNVIVLWTSGCEGDSSWVEDWASGPLAVTQEGGGKLSFDFYDDFVFNGQVNSSAKFTFGGTAEQNGAALDISASGDFTRGDTQWLMQGDFSVEVDDDEFTTNNCTVESEVEAYELVGNE